MLSINDVLQCRNYVADQIHYLSGIGLRLTVNAHLSEWAQFLKTAPENIGVNPAYDPEFCDLHPGNSFWLSLSDTNGETVATLAHKYLVSENYLAAFVGNRMWWGRHPKLESTTEWSPELLGSNLLISGRIGHHGGLWIYPNWRKHGLAGRIMRTCRAVALPHFELDWMVGTVFQNLYEKQYPTRIYGYVGTLKVVSGYFEETQTKETVYLEYISRAEMLRQFATP